MHELAEAPACPACRSTLDGATGVGHDEKPTAGDVTVCAYCFVVLEFTESLQLRELSTDELQQLPADVREDMARGISVVKAAAAKLGRVRRARA